MQSIARNLLALTLAVSGWASAQAGDTPSAREIVDRYVEAIGGRDALLSYTGTYATGRIEVPSQGIAGTFELWATPNRLLFLSDIPGLGANNSGYDGETGWANSAAMGPMVLDGLMLHQLQQQTDPETPLHPETQIASMETVGTKTFADREAYQIHVRTTWGEEYEEYYDVETGYLLGSEREQGTPMGPIQTTTVLSDYQEVGDLMVPMMSTQKLMGIEQIFATDTIEMQEVPNARFVLPDEIRAMAAAND